MCIRIHTHTYKCIKKRHACIPSSLSASGARCDVYWYIFTYTYVNTCIHDRTYLHVYQYNFVHIYIHKCICIFICVHIYVYLYVYTYIFILDYTYICTYIINTKHTPVGLSPSAKEIHVWYIHMQYLYESAQDSWCIHMNMWNTSIYVYLHSYAQMVIYPYICVFTCIHTYTYTYIYVYIQNKRTSSLESIG